MGMVLEVEAMWHRALTVPFWILAASVVLPAQGAPVHRETPLGTLPARWLEPPRSDASGWHMAGIAENDGKVRVWFDGREGPAFTAIAKGHPLLSAKGGRIAYDACTGPWEGGEHRGVVDGVPGPAFDALRGPEFSEDGRRVCYLGWRGRKVTAVIDGVAGPECDAAETVGFFDDGRRTAYRAWKDGKSFLVIDGVPQAPYDEIGAALPAAMPSGKLAYTARRGDRWFLVLDGVEGPACDGFGAEPAVMAGRLCYTVREGERWRAMAGDCATPWFDEVRLHAVTGAGKAVYSARDGEQWLVAVGATVGRGFHEVHYGSPAVGAGGAAAFIVRQGEQWRVWRDGELSPPYARFQYYGKTYAIGFSDDGAHLAYVVGRDGKWLVVTDGKAGPECDEIGVPVPLFAPGASAPTYSCVVGGKARMVLDGVPQPEYDEVQAVEARDGDGRARLAAYVARRGRKYAVVAAGKAAGWYDEVAGVVGAPDRKRVAFAARIGERWLAVVDGVEWPECDGFAQGPAFAPRGPGAVALAKYGERMAVIRDGKAGALHDLVLGPYAFPISEGFSPDGGRFAYAARDGAGWTMVVDGVPGPAFDSIAGEGPPAFREDARLEYLAIRERVLYRVEVGPGRQGMPR